jgi:TPR repeat protein
MFETLKQIYRNFSYDVKTIETIEKYKTLKQIFNKCNYNFEKIEQFKYLTDYILDVFNNKNIETNSSDSNKLLWNGIYYQHIENNYDEMITYYLMAIELGNYTAMNILGVYYIIVEKDCDEMKKYFLMAVELENSDAMCFLGFYYESIEKNYDEMKKYYLMAIELENSDAIKRCKNNNYFYDNNIKNKILNKQFKIIEEEFICPITLEKTNKCFITKCNHKFSDEILKCSVCPLCRIKI